MVFLHVDAMWQARCQFTSHVIAQIDSIDQLIQLISVDQSDAGELSRKQWLSVNVSPSISVWAPL